MHLQLLLGEKRAFQTLEAINDGTPFVLQLSRPLHCLASFNGDKLSRIIKGLLKRSLEIQQVIF
jgi:hypothetical protein